MNFEYTLNSTKWLIPWFKFYLLKNSLIQSFLILLVTFFVTFIFLKIKRKSYIILIK